MPARSTDTDSTLARNRRASHEYHILETFEAGIELLGTEVKSLRAGGSQIADAYIRIENGQIFLLGANIQPYKQGNRQNHEAARRRRLLLHRRQITHLDAEVRTEGLTLIPLRLYLQGNRVKLALGLCKGKKLWDKRQAIAEKDSKREADRAASRFLRS